MICSAARLRARLLTAAPFMVLGGLRWHAGGAAAALLLWLAIGVLFPCREGYPYPRKRKTRLDKLFFCCSLTALLTGGAVWTIRRFSPSGDASLLFDLLLYTGAVGFSLPIGKRALSLPLPRRLSWGLGALLCALLMILFIFQTSRS